MNDLSENVECLNELRFYKGGDNNEMSMSQASVDDMLKLTNFCEEYHVPQPQFYPYYDATGIQAEWNIGSWYMEADSSDQVLRILIVRNNDYQNAVGCTFGTVSEMAKFISFIFTYIFQK